MLGGRRRRRLEEKFRWFGRFCLGKYLIINSTELLKTTYFAFKKVVLNDTPNFPF